MTSVPQTSPQSFNGSLFDGAVTQEEYKLNFILDEPAPEDLNVQWIHGSISPKHNTDPDIQVHAYNEHTYIMRQNMAVHYEAPFRFLLFGNERAILLDTGATRSVEFFPLRQTVDALIERWLALHPRQSYSLVVAHTHLHLDHFEADSQFLTRPNTEIVGRSLEDTLAFYRFSNWPAEVVSYDDSPCDSSSGMSY